MLRFNSITISSTALLIRIGLGSWINGRELGCKISVGVALESSSLGAGMLFVARSLGGFLHLCD